MAFADIKYDALVVGLGNPGEQYTKTRHNLGWMVVDGLYSQFLPRVEGCWSTWNFFAKGLVSSGKIGDALVLMVKPTTMMNLSGEAVALAMSSFLPVDTKNIIVVHDELDIDFAEVRTKFGGGHAGHKGLRNIIEQLNTSDFHRVRCGIGRPAHGIAVIDHVLSPFASEETEAIPGMVQGACNAVQEIITNLMSQKDTNPGEPVV